MPRKLLMIDDDRTLTDLVRRYFVPRGWTFEGARTMKAGYARAASANPDLILLDLKLPDGDSWALLSKLKVYFKGIPIIMLSGAQTRPEDKAAGLMMKADDYMAKPLELNILEAKIEAILRWIR